MNKSAFILMLGVTVMLFSSCSEIVTSDTVNTDDIYQRYSVNYEPDGSGTVKAQFLSDAVWDRMEEEKTGGSTVDFGTSGAVTFNGVDMQREEGTLDGVYYTGLFPAGTEKIEFIWTDKEGKKYTNSAGIYPLKLDEKNVSKTDDGGWMIKWEGAPVQGNDKVVVQLKYSMDGKDHNMSETAYEAGINYVIFSGSAISNMTGQNIKVTAWREEIIRLENVTKAEGTIKVHGDGGYFTSDLWERIF